MSDFLIKKLNQIGIELTDKQVSQLDQYFEMLVETNKVMNLTAITEYEDVVVKHFVDSLAIVKVMQMSQVNTILDVGTGAGFPGMVLKIAFPHLKVTLLDSLNKRINFLKNVANTLELSDIEYLHGRAEDYARASAHREKYDLVVSRAVANLSTLSEYCLPYVSVGHSFVSYKAGDCMEEVEASKNAVSKLGGRIVKNEELILPETDITRRFIVVEKIKQTPKQFPRKAGVPSKEPIK